MAAEKSSLHIEVYSKGVDKAASQLDNLGNKAEQSEVKVRKLTDSLTNLANAQTNALQKATQHSNMMNAIGQAMKQVADSAAATSKSVQALTGHVEKLGIASHEAEQAIGRKSARSSVAATTLRAMAAAASAYLSINFAKGIIQAADAWSMMAAKLKLATGSMDDAKKVQQELFTLSQKLRVPLEDSMKLFTRMSIPMQKLGKDTRDTAEQVEFVALALKLGGATAAEASSVMLQYSQAVNAGRLNGAEFNAVSEAAPGILRAIEAELAATGQSLALSGKTLKQMGSDGEITFDLMQRAAKRALPQMRKDFEELPLTVDGAIQRVKNAWFKAMGELGEDTAMGRKLAEAVGKIEESIPAIRDGLITAFNLIYDNVGKIATALTVIVSMKVFSWAMETASGFVKLAEGASKVVTAVTGMGTATAAATGGMRLLAGSLGLLANPIGATVAGVTGLVLAYKMFAAEAPQANKEATNATFVGTVDRLKLIQKEIDKINELRGVQSGTGGKQGPTTVELPPDMQQTLNTINSLNKVLSTQTTKAGKESIEAEIKRHQLTLNRQNAELLSLNNVKKQREELEAQAKVQANVNEFMEKYGDNAYKAGKEIEKYKKLLGDAFTPDMEATIRKSFADKGKTDAQREAERKAAEAKRLAEQRQEEQDKYKQGLNEETVKIAGLVDAQRDLNDSYGRSALEQANLQAIKLEAQAADKESLALFMDNVTGGEMAAVQYREQAAALRELIKLKLEQAVVEDEAKGEKAGNKANDKALAEIDKYLDPSQAVAFGDALEGAFGKAGKALNGLSKGLKEYAAKMEIAERAREALNDVKDTEKRAKLEAAITKREVKDKLNAYGDMAGAAKGFFKENTLGYKILHATEQGFRIAEMAWTFQSMQAKVTASTTVAAAKGMEGTAALLAAGQDTAATGISIGNSMAKAAASTAAGVAKAFEYLGPFGFAAAAAIIAFMASMGVSAGGSGSSPSLSEQRQKKQGTGTVLGDEDAKSGSIANSLEMLKENSNIALKHSSSMLMALQRISDGIAGMAKFVAQTSGLRGTTADLDKLGVGSSKSMLGFSSKKTELLDSGIAIGDGQTIGDMMDGIMARGYADLKITKKKAWGLKKSTKRKTEYSDLDGSLLEQIELTVQSLTAGLVAAGEAFGKDGNLLEQTLKDLQIDIGKISLKGLSGDEIAAELEAAFGKLGDQMAKSVLGGFEDFQLVGEGYFETVVRVAAGVEQAKFALDQLGVSMIDYMHVVNKNNEDVAAEVIRDSLMAKEQGSMVRTFMEEFNGSASEMVETYKTLVDVRTTLKLTGLGNDISREIIRGAGGLENLQSSLEDFYDMFSDTEKFQMAGRKLRTEFSKLGFEMPRTAEAFRSLVQYQTMLGAGGQEMAGKLLQLSGAFSELLDMAESGTEAARDNLLDAYERERDALQETKEKFEDFGKSLREFQKSLLQGGLSPLTQSEKFGQAKAEYERTFALAQAGDQTALEKFESVASQFLTLSREYYASGDGYLADFNRVMTETAYLADYSDYQADVATASLEALNKQVEGLIDVNESVLTVAQAIQQLQDATIMSFALLADPQALQQGSIDAGLGIFKMISSVVGDTQFAQRFDGSHANGLSYVPYDGYAAELHEGEAVLTASENRAYQMNMSEYGRKTDVALVNEIKALRDQVKQLQDSQRANTADLIATQYEVADKSTQAIVDGTKDAMSEASWNNNSQVGLA